MDLAVLQIKGLSTTAKTVLECINQRTRCEMHDDKDFHAISAYLEAIEATVSDIYQMTITEALAELEGRQK